MCGIAGILRTWQPGEAPPDPLDAIPEAWLDILDDSIKHRGPDGQGRFRDRAVRPDGTVVDVAFVHRRLSIIDHAGGHQPMVHDAQRLRPDLTYARGETPRLAHELCPASERPDLVAVVFNGCIYNHRELRAELEGLGHRFETDHSDTEVLVHGWRAWGFALQDRVDGMLAQLLWDRPRAQLVVGRDLAGEKPIEEISPLDRPGLFMFSSVPAALGRAVPAVPLDGRALLSFVRNGSGARTRRDQSHEWPGRWTLRFGHRTRHGDLTKSMGDDRLSPHNVTTRGPALPRLRESGTRLDAPGVARLLAESVRERLEADVPLGIFLSGGVDSALIAAIARTSRPDIETFTIRMPDARYNESDAAAETAKSIGVAHTILDCQPEPAANLVRLIEQLGLPFGDSSLLPTYWVSKAARQHVKVALSGDGGDELFGGYRRHAINPTLTRWRHLLRHIPAGLLDQRKPAGRSTYLARLAAAARFGGYSELLAIFPTPDLRMLIPEIDGHPTGDDTFRSIDDPLRHDFEHYLPDDLLRKTDTASMAVALEVRAPFLARDLVEAALRTPLFVLMPRGQRKGLLKQVARRYLPDHIVDRPKQGFAIPIGDWFRTDYGGMRQLLYDHLDSADPFPGLAEAGVAINMAFVRTMLRQHDAAGEKSLNPWHGRDHSQRLYMLLVLSIWAKWLDGVRRSGPE